ncbi:MAG: hypothetical protein A2W72_01185 [Burkholderiales bacterium RIFCSPLOWO2_12_67_14]|nr:MAG: hypothetical protein A3I64_24070 [Burkholderiales bacterium RIFCSPLOWO2_02_FULL_67_64]OGB48079.1 MAG: hypothetical protein A2W72_01185 [Burkholderiales bacterium RIFCSPLOWO2_12_67_14]OGB50773.1 MAG: hypothetical protein A3E51_10120 [Burkholderiales bacterium RIFCSPHIGHO2_12_FULL_67_38]OGB77012.1 MAG: hypothetical protein A3G82_14025 [Burkholderiales bacterium RIFCSPLOWO2_12_FULL_67_210]
MARFNRFSKLGLVVGLVLAQVAAYAAFDAQGNTVPAQSSGLRLLVQPDNKAGGSTLAMLPASPMCTYLGKRCEGGDGSACKAYFANC